SDADVARVIDAIQDSCLEIRRGGFFPEASGCSAAQANGEVDEKKKLPTEASNRIEPPTRGLTPATGALSTLVEIQPCGSRTPLFCTPAADGFTRVYHQLSDHLGSDQPLYGL